MVDVIPEKSREDIEHLKREWATEPTWDIEDTDGFGAYRAELLAYSAEMQAKWEAEERERNHKEAARLSIRALELGCSTALVQHIESLERQIRELQHKAFDGL